jgi:hypothetical protein
MKQARSKSPLASLFADNESVLLYGNKSIHYIHHGEQKTSSPRSFKDAKYCLITNFMTHSPPL